MPLINIGSAVGDGTGTPGPRTWSQLINRLPNPDSTINAGSGDYVGTTEAKITLAIADAVLGGKKYVFVPQSMLPYNASLVTFNANVRMIREGANPQAYDLIAYGAYVDGVTDDTASWTAAIAALVSSTTNDDGFVQMPSGTSLGTITIPTDKRVRIIGAGCDESILKAPSGTGVAITTSSTHIGTGWHCEFRDFSVNGNAATSPTILMSGMTKMLMSRIRIFNCGGTALKIFGCWDCAFFDVFVSGTGGDVGASASPVILDGVTGNETDECSFYRLHIEPGSTNQTYLDLQGQNANTVRFCDFYYLKCAGNFNTGQPTGNPLMKLSGNANDNVVIGGTMAYANGAPQVQVSGSRNRFCYISHVAGVAFPTFAYSFLSGANDNEVVGFSINSSSYTGGHVNVASGSSRTRILAPTIVAAQATLVVDAGFQTHWEQPQTRPGFTVGGGGSSTPNPTLGKHHDIVATGSTQTINAPTPVVDGMELHFTIQNNSGGTLTTTWNSVFKLAGAWVDPANTKRRTIWFKYLAYLPGWVEMSRAAADI